MNTINLIRDISPRKSRYYKDSINPDLLESIVGELLYNKGIERMLLERDITDLSYVFFVDKSNTGDNYYYSIEFSLIEGDYGTEVSHSVCPEVKSIVIPLSIYSKKILIAIVSSVGAIVGTHRLKINPRAVNIFPNVISDLIAEYEGGSIDVTIDITASSFRVFFPNIDFKEIIDFNLVTIMTHQLTAGFSSSIIMKGVTHEPDRSRFKMLDSKNHNIETTDAKYYPLLILNGDMDNREDKLFTIGKLMPNEYLNNSRVRALLRKASKLSSEEVHTQGYRCTTKTVLHFASSKGFVNRISHDENLQWIRVVSDVNRILLDKRISEMMTLSNEGLNIVDFMSHIIIDLC